jgi:hypothetical protein
MMILEPSCFPLEVTVTWLLSELVMGPVWHNLFYSFFTEISSNRTK